MLDASSKIPSGILQGNMKDIGMYDECHSAITLKDNITIKGRHCMYTASVTMLTQNITIKPTLSVCLPAVCDSTNVNKTLQLAIDRIKYFIKDWRIEISSVVCSDPTARPWSTGAIITM